MGDFLIAGPNIALLNSLTGASFPITPPYKLTGEWDIDADVYRVDAAKAQVGQSEAEVGVTVTARPGQRAQITAEILSHNLDLHDFGKVSRKPVPERKGVSPRGLSREPLHLAKLDWADVHLTARAQRIHGDSMPLDNLAVRVDIVDGAMTFHQLNIGIGQGRISGDVQLAPRTA